MRQLQYLQKDITRILGKDKWRIFIVFFSRIFVGIFWYRVDRGWYLFFGHKYYFFRILLSPFFNLIQAYTNIDIHYKANIGEGLLILHSSPGIVISGKAIIGNNLTLTGGNTIGMSDKPGVLIIGNYCSLGANACIIGPLILTDHIKIGSCACVVKSFSEGNLTLVGVPAKSVNKLL